MILRTGFQHDKQTLFKMPLPNCIINKWEHSIILITTPPVSYHGASQSNNLLHTPFLEYWIIVEADLFFRVMKIHQLPNILYLSLYPISQSVKNIAASYYVVFCFQRKNLGKVMSDNLIGKLQTYIENPRQLVWPQALDDVSIWI